jgi:tetratricopeptide (TPR) repeat protein
MPASDVARRSGSLVWLTTALAGTLAAAWGCSSSASDPGWKGQKAYGAKMAKQGYWREALFRFEKAAKEQPDDAEIQNDLAVAYEANGETVKALAAYRRAIELAPNDSSIRRNYARFAEYYTSAQRVAAPAEVALPGGKPPAGPVSAPAAAPAGPPPAPAPTAPPPPVPTRSPGP